MTSASDVLRAMFEHHLWATTRLIVALEELEPEDLDARIDGHAAARFASMCERYGLQV